MKDSFKDRYPAYLPAVYQVGLLARKVYRQSLVRFQESKAKKQQIDPLLLDGKLELSSAVSNPLKGVINKCAYWYEEDLNRLEIKTVVDQMLALKQELSRRGLRFTNTAGNFLLREYHAETRRGKLWENAWVAHHAGLQSGQRVADIGGASTFFSFYLASLGCDVTVIDNDWANCGTLFNANYVARKMGWKLRALDRDVDKPLPFSDNSLDRVFSICVLEHLPPLLRQKLMKEIGRVLKPGGIAGFTTDYDAARPVLVTDKGLRFAYREKLERDVIDPSGLMLYGESCWADACSAESFLGAFFLHKPS